MISSIVAGSIVPGHRVASGAAGDPRFPDGTIALQLPLLRARIPGFDAYLGGAAFAGTINFEVEHGSVQIRSPEISLERVRWTPHFPFENFFLSRCVLGVPGSATVPAFLYLPDPTTKPDHFQPDSTVELLSRYVPGLGYGTRAELRYDPAALAIVRPPGSMGSER